MCVCVQVLVSDSPGRFASVVFICPLPCQRCVCVIEWKTTSTSFDLHTDYYCVVDVVTRHASPVPSTNESAWSGLYTVGQLSLRQPAKLVGVSAHDVAHAALTHPYPNNAFSGWCSGSRNNLPPQSRTPTRGHQPGLHRCPRCWAFSGLDRSRLREATTE